MPRTRKALSELEHQIMEVLWARGPATSEQVREALGTRRPLADSTIRTILRRLLAKGYVRQKSRGRTYVYSALDEPRNLAIRAVQQLIDRFCRGSVEELLTGMVEHEVLDREELNQLARKIAKRNRGE
jgi:predicted transcriptional regulator